MEHDGFLLDLKRSHKTCSTILCIPTQEQAPETVQWNVLPTVYVPIYSPRLCLQQTIFTETMNNLSRLLVLISVGFCATSTFLFCANKGLLNCIKLVRKKKFGLLPLWLARSSLRIHWGNGCSLSFKIALLEKEGCSQTQKS